jgi:transmembrane sensor
MSVVNDPQAAPAAIDWLIRQQDPAFADWEAFTLWLEADPLHALAYDETAASEAAVADRLSAGGVSGATFSGQTQITAPREAMPRRRFFAAAIAAAVVAMFGAYQLRPADDLYTIATAPGEQRTVTLAGGTSIALNGRSRLTLDRDNLRYASLDAGQAAFDVIHDDANPFEVEVGGAKLVDLGTRFDVLREGGVTEVRVAEGLVMFNPEAEAIRLSPGRMLRSADGETEVRLGAVDVEAVGSWREGLLIYDAAPLDQVARDLSRNLGFDIVADPAVATRPVTGIVQIPKDREQLAQRLEKLFDITVRRSNSDWIFTPKH